VAEKTCPTCGDQNVHANIPSEIIACATRKALVDALHAYAEMIDERSYPMQRFTDLFASMARRLDDDLFVTARVCEVVIGLGWRPGGAS